MGMLEKFRLFIQSNDLCQPTDRILLAVSGGIDSMVLLHLFAAAGYTPGVAHCNFHLRGAESDGDEQLVKSVAVNKEAAYYQQDFNTEQSAAESGISIQMAARNLRYQWFEEIRKNHGYDFIATAHNQDDVIETFFINLVRGTGIRGLTGIPLRSGKVIRPLLFASRESIVEYATDHDIRFREDSSNASDKYLRNRLRHQLIPMLEEENPSFRNALMDTMLKLSETEKLYLQELEKLKHRLLRTEGDITRIRIKDLSAYEARRSILFEILTEFNFSSQAMEDILHSLEGPSGKQFLSTTHRVVKDRDDLIITPLDKEEDRKYYLEREAGRISEPVNLEWMVVDHTETFHIPNNRKIACLDLLKLEFPLMLRHWRSGDYFQPLGMQGMKKISDYLIDTKVSLPDKERTWLLTSGSKIAWVIGKRIDDRFKVRPKTRQVLLMKFTNPFPTEP
jgi:tRNA(Ile)-lysidine synthase